MAKDRKSRTASKRSRTNAVTLDIDGPVLTPEAFKKAVDAFVDLIREVSGEVAGGNQKIQWDVTVASGSRLVTASAIADTATMSYARATVAAINNGIRRLERGFKKPPAFFTERALRATRDLANVRQMPSASISYVRLRVNGKKTELNVKVGRTASILIGEQSESYGCVEGKLQTVSERGSFQFVVYDDLFDRGVNCFISENLIRDALAAFGKRVAVFGLLQYDSTGKPISIQVERIEVFPDESELPTIESLRGIFNEAETETG
jgi:hypothetical protein